MPLGGRRIVVGVSGGIAAYKSAYLVRRLLERGADVRCVMTPSATEFLGPATLAGLTGHDVVTSLTAQTGSVSPHTELAAWADLIVVAPATTATIARLAAGLSEEPLSATVIAARSPVMIAPAMHTEMWEYPATQRNIATLLAAGVHVVGPASGHLAGGDVGSGRMVEPEEILAAVDALFTGPLDGLVVLVTAGGTREAIDPVRYIGNRSSGKMGHAIAEEAVLRGAKVVLVTASSMPSSAGIDRHQVESALEMQEAVAAVQADIAVMAAAVADFRPAASTRDKLVRADGPPEIRLEPTPDILKSVADRADRPFLVGFAAETGSLQRAVEKAKRKGVDLLVANDVTEAGSGFGVDTNRVTLITPDGSSDQWEQMQKTEVARRLWDAIVHARNGGSGS
ncbi:MAG TPA: bifunctional phosphopantothenoylcysteine decarboxylase/phosphopantothenate--cysteine ligase CoaBC [Acidimicrobiia bacterium]|nr:bifunctional phosphopantothenoylcysteine decarboxylase/phosphopantothenate--cysteine ligase CoaBC [Acidimicrobiia bacterium]